MNPIDFGIVLCIIRIDLRIVGAAQNDAARSENPGFAIYQKGPVPFVYIKKLIVLAAFRTVNVIILGFEVLVAAAVDKQIFLT